MAVASRMSLEEFLRLPEEEPELEYACGKVVQKPTGAWNHSMIQGFLQILIGNFLRQTGLGRVGPELRCIFGPPGRERVYVPDLCYVAKEHYPEGPYLRTGPDLAVEVLSPGQNIAWLLDKAQFYLLNGARSVWVIDPGAGTIAVLSPGEEGRTLTTGEMLDGGEVLPGFSVPVDEVFAQGER
jgi:Uma2 family endonuclease